jgi:predicted secreted protein
MASILFGLINITSAIVPVIEWSRTYPSPYSEGIWSLHNTSDGGFILAGYISIGGEGADLWLVKTDSQGYMQWNRTFGGSEEDIGYSVDQTSDGGYIVTGSTKSYGLGNERLWLLKIDSNGSKEWDRTFGGFASASGEAGWSVEQTEDRGYIVAGYTMSYGAGGKDVWLIKTDSVGNKQWDRTFGGRQDDTGMSVVQTRDRGYIVTGRTGSLGSGGDDIWLLKTDSLGKEKGTLLLAAKKMMLAFRQ